MSRWDYTIGRIFGRKSSEYGKGTQDGFVVSPVRLNPQPTTPTEEQVRAVSIPAPYSNPGDFDNFGRETSEMRARYREYFRVEPAVKSAIEGLVNSVADMDVSVIADDEDSDVDKRAADFVNWSVERSDDGWDGIIKKTILPALIDGWSLSEVVMKTTTEGRKFGGLWSLKKVVNKNTDNISLRLDAFHNVEGIVNMIRGVATYNLDKFILYTHADLFNNPFGASELRAAYRACQLIDDAYKLWHFALRAYGAPFIHGRVSLRENKKAMMQAMEAARANGFIVTSDQDAVEVVNLASATSFSAFNDKIHTLREDVFLTIRGGYLPFMQGASDGGETRGSAAASGKHGSDPKERMIAKAVGRLLTHQVSKPITRDNFGNHVGVPRVVLGGTDWAETLNAMSVAERANAKVPISKRWFYTISQVMPPTDKDDEIPVASMGQPGMPPGGMPALGPGAGGMPGPGSDDQPPEDPNQPNPNDPLSDVGSDDDAGEYGLPPEEEMDGLHGDQPPEDDDDQDSTGQRSFFSSNYGDETERFFF